jgi:Ribonuclease G/E
MSETEYNRAVAEFLARKNITRCPTACVVPTRASVGEADRVALRNYDAAREAARQAKLRNYQQLLAS